VGQSYRGRVAALDLGEAYTGVALSDPGGTLASPLEVVPADRLNEYLRGLFVRETVPEIVVGVPKTMGGEIGFQARRVLDTLETLREEFPAIRFVPWDERLTTRVARSAVAGGPKRRQPRRARERVDHLAAAAMLQEYLDRGRAFEAAR
jgi:putative Holliday junction resolvase